MPILGAIGGGGDAPAAPTIGAVTAGNGQASIAFSPNYLGLGGTVTYVATTNDGIEYNNTTGSPIVVGGLTNGVTYTISVRLLTDYGVYGESSAPCSPFVPVAPPPPPPPPPPPVPPPVPPPPPPVPPPPPPETK